MSRPQKLLTGPVLVGGARHSVAPKDAWPWLPVQGHAILAPHPYCEDCGLVKAIGVLPAYPAGTLVNLLARLETRLAREGCRITQAQRRLIIKKLAALGAHDKFGLSREGQLALFAEAVAAYTGLAPGFVEGHLRSC